jgi:hypothetical protein
MARCKAQFQTSCGMLQCGLPQGHYGSHSKADGAVDRIWSDQEAYIPTEDVPIFRIKASDPFACAIIRCWIVIASSYKRLAGKETIRVSAEKISGAEDRLQEFLLWQQEHGTKVPD